MAFARLIETDFETELGEEKLEVYLYNKDGC